MRTRTGCIVVLAAAAVVAAFSYACSGSTSPTSADAGVGDGGGINDASPEATGPCIPDTKRVAKDDAGVCCAGLFKACVGSAFGSLSPCICSTVACGTAAMQPPLNVPCCPPPLRVSATRP